jgi:hypothetical protein
MERDDAPELRPGDERPDSDRAEMRIGFTVSCVAHGTIVALLAFGLPITSNPRLAIDQVVPVNVVTVAEKPAAPKVEPPKPQPPKKPDPPKEEAKAEPPKPAPPPPPPPPEPPQAKPEPPKVEPPKPEPPPKAVEKPKPPEPKKAEPPKPPPKPQQLAKAEPAKKEPPKKQEPDPFESVLKSVEKLKPTQRPEITPPTPRAAPPPPAQQTALNFGEQITATDLDAVRERIRPCWNPNFGGRNAQDLVVEIEVWANPDGTVLKAQPRANMRMSSDPFYQSAASAAMRAVLNERCQPLPLPREKYEQWKFFVLVFDPKQMLGM